MASSTKQKDITEKKKDTSVLPGIIGYIVVNFLEFNPFQSNGESEVTRSDSLPHFGQHTRKEKKSLLRPTLRKVKG